jgi:hypothetical protein
VPESVITRSNNLLEELRVQIDGKEYDAAMLTVGKLQENGGVDAVSMTQYMALKARAEMGVGNKDAARTTIDELERGTDELAVVYVLRGELEMKNGNRAAAQTEFAKARRADASIAIPKL